MITGRNIGGECAVEVELGAVFEDETRGLGDVDALAGATDDHGRRRRRVALGAHRAAQSLARRRRRDAPLPERIVIAVRDAPGVGHLNVGGPEMAPHTPQRSARPE